MSLSTLPIEVNACAVHLAESGDGLVLELAAAQQPNLRLLPPPWVAHQLMRVLPRVDAALQQGRDQVNGSLIAYPLLDWTVESAGVGQGVALHLVDERMIEAAFVLSPETAAMFQRELDAAMQRSQVASVEEVFRAGRV